MGKSRKTLEDNRGFTLVELIAAIGILLLVVVPLLHAFVTSAKTNKKAREKLEATTVAENVMEQIKAADLEQLLAEAEYEETEGIYHWDVIGQVNEQEYQVEAVLDPDTYQTTDGSVSNTDYNSIGLAEIGNMDGTSNASYVQELALDQKAAEGNATPSGWNLKATALEESKDPDRIYENMIRNITVRAVKENGISKVYVTISYSYQYEYQTVDPDSGELGEIAYDTVTVTPENQKCIYTAEDRATELLNIYLFYVPMYTGSSSEVHETITFQNEMKEKVNLYLIKQNTSQTDEIKEMNYHTNIQVIDTGRSNFVDEMGDLIPQTSLRTNLKESQRELYYGSSVDTLATMVEINGVTYSAAELLSEEALAVNKPMDVLYTVTVTVREKGNTDELVSLKGTKEK